MPFERVVVNLAPADIRKEGASFDLPMALAVLAAAEKIPPAVAGVVTAVSKNLVEISLGSDDGIRDGHQLDVFNNTNFLGRIKIRRTAPNRAGGEIIPEYSKGEIKKGDRVATRLTRS